MTFVIVVSTMQLNSICKVARSLLIVFFALLFSIADSNGQKLVLNLAKNEAYLPQNFSHTGTVLEENTLDYKVPGIVLKKKFIVKYLSLNPQQTAYQKYRKGEINAEKYASMVQPFDIDSSLARVSRKPIKCTIGILIYDIKNVRYFVADSDNNKDFTNNKVFSIHKDSLLKNKTAFGSRFRFQALSQKYHNGKIYDISNVYELYPYHKHFSYTNPIENDFFCVIGEAEKIYSAKPEKGLRVDVFDQRGLKIVDKMLVKIRIDTNGQTERLFYEVGDTLKYGSNMYRVDSIQNDFSKLYLTKYSNLSEFEGSMAGLKAYDFKVKDFMGDSIHLYGQKGKYVLLDFWGTWCGPCVASIPFLKELYAKYQPDKLTIIGIAVERNEDSSKFGSFLQKEQIPWLVFFQPSVNRPVKDLLSIRYKVQGYPTYILVGPDSRIIYRSADDPDKDLRTIDSLISSSQYKL